MAPVYEVLELSLFSRNADVEDIYSDEPSVQIQRSSASQPDEKYMYKEPLLSYSEEAKPGLKNCLTLPWKAAHWKKMILRTLLLIFTLGVALAIPCLSQLIALISGFTLTFNGFIIGPLCNLSLQYMYKPKKETLEPTVLGIHNFFLIWWDVFLILFGFVIGFWTIYLSVLDLVKHAGKCE